MSVGAEPRPIELPLPGGRDGAAVKLHPLLTATMNSPPGLLERPPGRLAWPRFLATPRSRWIPLPIPAFLVEHPEAGPVMIDTGIHPSVATDPKQNLGRFGAAIYDTEMEPGQAAGAQLKARGIDPEALETVVMTHLHSDHASGVSQFPAATFVLDKREWDAAIRPRGDLRGYHHLQFDHAFDWRTIDYEAPEIDSFETFGGSVDLFGDGSIRLLSTPGHTLGHQSVLLRLDGREALLCGDAAYLRRTISDSVAPLITHDEHQFWRSLKEIRRFAGQTPGLLVIPGHDGEAWAALEKSY